MIKTSPECDDNVLPVPSGDSDVCAVQKDGSSLFIPHDRNPFSVNYTQPGSIPFFFESSFIQSIKKEYPGDYQNYFRRSFLNGEHLRTSIGLEFLADQFQRDNFSAQINGVHGSGKSTLLNALERTLKNRGFHVFFWTLHDQQRQLPDGFWNKIHRFLKDVTSTQPADSSKKTLVGIVILDGFEQLSCANQWFFRLFCRVSRLGILLSSHQVCFGIPVLFKTTPTCETLQRIVRYLLDDVEFCYDGLNLKQKMVASHQNIRDILFELYDEYENHHVVEEHLNHPLIRRFPR